MLRPTLSDVPANTESQTDEAKVALLPPPFNFESARDALLGPSANEIMDFLFRLNTGQSTDAISERVRKAVTELGWVSDDGRRFTPDGMLVADSIREYVFWLQRDRKLHCEGEFEYLSAAHYAGKSVLEIGCGFGCNLIPIAKVAKRVVGIEPVGIYRDMGRILCEREKLKPIEILAGNGEDIPIRDQVFDIVLCVSAHQYMDVRTAIREMVRLLAPDGELQIVGGTLGVYLREDGKRILSGSLSRSITYAITAANTLSYMAIGRRIYHRSHRSSTAFPIYPTRRRMARWLSDEGLVPKRPHDRFSTETSFCFERPHR